MQSTECKFNKTSSMLSCNSSIGYDSCQATVIGRYVKYSMFAIGETKATGGENPLVWHRLYPRKEDNSGWLYYKSSKQFKLSIHSKGKNSPHDEGLVIHDEICWVKLSVIIRSSKSFETIKADKYTKTVFGNSYEKVKMIGTLKNVA